MEDKASFSISQAFEWLRRWRMPRWEDRGHEVVCGIIGMGKSYWVLYEILHSFERNCPCTYIDPKGDTYRKLLTLLATTRQGRACYRKHRERILFLNSVSASGYILGFNALAPAAPSSMPNRINQHC